jgi:hypothetical protein
VPSILERLQRRIHGFPSWPPPDIAGHWEKVQGYRRRFDAQRDELVMYAIDLNRTANGRSIFTPAPLARELGQFSSAMLFSSEPAITFEDDADLLDEVMGGNAIMARAIAAAARIAIEGRGAWRVHLDESVSDVPQIHYVPEDQVIWEERHGDIVIGGGVVIERRPTPGRDLVYRLVEEHEVGKITRTLYQGAETRLGDVVALDTVAEFAGLDEVLDTDLDAPTLFRWNNKPGGESDLAGLEALLDRYDEGWSLLVDKMRKSVPVSFADASLFDDKGQVDLSGVIPIRRGNLARAMGDEPSRWAETVQPDLQAEAHIAVLNRLREEIFADAGYSLASYGLDVAGTADSGTALRLKQARTIQTKNAKEWEATEALKNALACAMCWHDKGTAVKDYRPEIKLADAMPRDEREIAQTVTQYHAAEAISLEEMIRARRPDWDDEAVEEEAERIRGEKPQSTVPQLPPLGNLNPLDPLAGGDEDADQQRNGQR